MKKNKVNFSILISELDNDINLLNELFNKYKLVNKKIKNINPDEFDWASLGYTIHNIYNLFENYFLRVSKFFENDLPGQSCHKELINRMTIEINGLRPALIDKYLANELDELRAFRHIFRNIYQSELDIEGLKIINQKVSDIFKSFINSHKYFIEKLNIIKNALK